TTFNTPDCRDMVMAGRPNMGGTDRGLLTSGNYGANPAALGAAGGAQSRTATTTIAQANLPNVNFPVSGITLNNPAANVNTCLEGSSCPNAPGTIPVVAGGADVARTFAQALSNVSVNTQGSA